MAFEYFTSGSPPRSKHIDRNVAAYLIILQPSSLNLIHVLVFPFLHVFISRCFSLGLSLWSRYIGCIQLKRGCLLCDTGLLFGKKYLQALNLSRTNTKIHNLLQLFFTFNSCAVALWLCFFFCFLCLYHWLALFLPGFPSRGFYPP